MDISIVTYYPSTLKRETTWIEECEI